jgi:hypothetical protein
MLAFAVSFAGFMLAKHLAHKAGGVWVQALKTIWFVIAVWLETRLMDGKAWLPHFMGGPEAIS